ncbi:MAG: hypothetical protein RL695_1134 [Pseudomonadota bacterium]
MMCVMNSRKYGVFQRAGWGGGMRLSVLSVLLVGCASNAPAPVIDRTVPGSLQGELGHPAAATAAATSAASAVPAVPLGPDMYLVKKGDTLRAIALDHGQSYRDLAAWNGLSDPNRIEVGQALRIAPPGASSGGEPVAMVKPVNMSGGVEPAAAGGVASAAGVVASTSPDGQLKRSPKGGKQPYTPDALEKMQKAESTVGAGATAPVAAVPPVPVIPPTSVVPPVASVAPAVAATAKPSDETVDWAWPGTGKLIGGFVEDKNKGVDLAGKSGEPVLAAATGKVILVSNALRGYGNFVIIKHNNTFLSVYAHNSRILVKEEQSVSKGQKIAEIGSSDADQPKLHFEIRRQGKPVDPLKLLPVR